MTTVERLCSVLGPPQALQEVTDDRSFLGAVGPWSHQGAKVDLRGTDTVQVIFNVSGGHRVKRLIRAGSDILSCGFTERRCTLSPLTARLVCH